MEAVSAPPPPRATATSSGSSAFSASAARSAAGPPSTREARDLAARVHARVGAARDGEPAPGREDAVERLAQHALDRALARLPRPAAEPGAVVLERQPERPRLHAASLGGRVAAGKLEHGRHRAQVRPLRRRLPGRPVRDLRRRCGSEDPVFCQPGVDGETMIWFVTRYDDVAAVLLDDERFVRDPRLALTPEQLAEGASSPAWRRSRTTCSTATATTTADCGGS